MANTLDKTLFPNVGFKLGTQNSANDLITNGGATHGTFYLTQDTHRLYVGNSDGTLSSVNEGIIFVNSVNDLPAYGNPSSPLWPSLQGQFYYVSGVAGASGTTNVLCVASGTRWVQINPDTYIESYNTTVTALPTDQATKTGAQIATTITQAGGRSDINMTRNTSFEIAVGSSNLHLATSGNTITLSCDAGATYTLTQENLPNDGGVRVSLVGSNNTTDYFDIVKSNQSGCIITPTVDTDGNIVLSGGMASTWRINVDENANDPGKIEIYLTNSADQHGTESARLVLKPNIILHDNSNNVGDYDPTTGNLDITLPVYTVNEVDALLRNLTNNLDAMYFAGTIGISGTLPSLSALANLNNTTMTVKNGATFKVITADPTASPVVIGVTLNGNTDNSVEIGDLIIVRGQEYQNTDSSNATTYTTDASRIGYIVPSTMSFEYVPSGDDWDMYYTPNVGTGSNANNNAITFTEHAATGGDVYTIDFAAGRNSGTATATPPVISATVTDSGLPKTIKIDHATIAANGASSQPAVSGHNPSFTAITGISLTNGHVTGYQTTQFSVTPNKVKTVRTTATSVTANQSVKIDSQYVHSTGELNDYSNGFKVSSSSLKVAIQAAGAIDDGGTNATTADVSVDLVWGQF